MPPQIPHIVIAGAGFAGLGAAARLAGFARQRKCRLTVLNRSPEFLFLPSLPWMALGRAEAKALRRRLDRVRALRHARLLVAELQGIDPRRQTLMTSDGRLSYDLLVLAVGTRPDEQAIPGYAVHAFDLWTPEHAAALQQRLRQGARQVVVAAHHMSPCNYGMVELAFALAGRGLRVHLVTSEPGPGDTLHPQVRRVCESLARRRGIVVHAPRTVVEITGRGALLDDGRALDADLVVASPPPRGPEFMRDLAPGITRSALLLTRSNLSSVRWKWIYGAGGVVATSPPSTGHTAEQMGAVAAANAAVALELRSGNWRDFEPGILTLLDLGGTWGLFQYRRPAPGFGAVRRRWLVAGRPLGLAKPLFRRVFIGLRL